MHDNAIADRILDIAAVLPLEKQECLLMLARGMLFTNGLKEDNNGIRDTENDTAQYGVCI